MMGKSHLVAGVAVTGTVLSVLHSAGDTTHPVTELLDQGLAILPWTGEHLCSEAATWLWQWVVPLGASPGAWGLGYVVAATVLLLLGSLLPDVDSPSSMLGRHVPWVAALGPHHGLSHTDWLLWVLFAASLPEPTRVLVWLWFGALVHCELDGLSRAGRVRFYPLGRYKVVLLGPERTRCVVRAGRRRGLYLVGKRSEAVVLSVLVLVCASISSAAWLLA